MACSVRLLAGLHDLLGGCCLVCGSTEQLEIDHALGGGGDRHRAVGRGAERYRILDALRADPWDGRFILLCRSCHRIKTNEQRRAAMSDPEHAYARARYN